MVTASIAGLTAYSPDPVYSMTKHAVVGLVRALAPQLWAKKITINAVCPGLVDTPLLDAAARELAEEANFPLIPPADIAEAVFGRVVGTETGGAYVCQPGRPPTAYRFAGVPGPGGAAAGRTPPEGLAAERRPGRGSKRGTGSGLETSRPAALGEAADGPPSAGMCPRQGWPAP